MILGNLVQPNPMSGGGGTSGINGNVLLPLGVSSGGDDYFDPVTLTATEGNFIRFLEDGNYTSDVIGYKVVLSNTTEYDGGTWVIADFNHNSENIGITNYYDLISLNCFGSQPFYTGYSSDGKFYYGSDLRTWLRNNLYSGFSSNFRARMMNLKYSYWSEWWEDTVVALDIVELGFESGDYRHVPYPVFSDNISRIKYKFGTTSPSAYWTRELYSMGWGQTSVVSASGAQSYDYNDSRYCVAPVIRVS